MRRTWITGAVAATAVLAFGISPVLAATTQTVTVKPGNTLWTLSKQYGTTVQALQAANPSVNPMNLQVGTVLKLPAKASASNTVVVQPGQTLWLIARAHGLSVQALQAANPHVNPMNLQVGTTLTVPASKTAPPAKTSQPPTTTRTAATAQNQTTAQQNLYWMERVINAEAGGLSLQAQIAVGDVVMHRLKAGGYGTTVHDVVFQVISGHYQFTSVANGMIYSTPSAASDQAAVDVLDHSSDVVPGAMVFYNPAKTPGTSWVRRQPILKTIGPLVFAK